MRDPAARWRAAVAGLFLCCQIVSAAAPAIVAAQTSTGTAQAQRPPVQRGQEYYEQSRFDEAITLLKDLVDRGILAGEELQKARELLARSYVKKGYPVQAKEMFKAILRTEPNWRPDPIRVPPDETAIFEQALKEYQEEKPTSPAPSRPATTPSTPPSSTPASPATIGIQSEKKPLMKQWWVWALGVGAVAGIAAAAGGGGGGDGGGGGNNDQPYFPPTP